jgi:ubiquinone/menaquinone biosynthesis C-methylase UbiE
MHPSSRRKVQYTIPLPTKFIKFVKNKSIKAILEVGCGYGRVCFFLRKSRLCVTGVDVDKEQVGLALLQMKKQGICEGIDLIINDVRNLCFPDSSFDAVTMLGVLTLISKKERSKLMSEVYRVLKPLGYLFIEEFGRTWENPIYRKRYKDDVEVTGELGTVTVKDETGRILHFGHHFTHKEICCLLRDFCIISLEKDIFTSYYHRNWVNGYIILTQKKPNSSDFESERVGFRTST